MKDEVLAALAGLASLPYQKRYIVGGTVDEYILPEELLEDICGLVLRLKMPENRPQFSGAQTSALDALARFIDDRSDEALQFSSRDDLADKIVNGETWAELRLLASAALNEFGVRIDAISVEDIDQGRIS
jgi:hypothetical protein